MNGKVRIGGDILASEKDEVSGSISFSTGDAASGSANPGDTESWQQCGFASRPSDVTEDKQSAAQCLVVQHSSRDIAFATRDVRCQSIYANLRAGETCVFAGGSDGKAQGRILIKDNGSINLYTKTSNDANGNGMAVLINPDDDSITLINGKGFAFIINDDGITITTGKAGITLTADGAIKVIATTTNQIDGSSIILGSNPVALNPVTGAALKGPTGLAATPSLKTVIE